MYRFALVRYGLEIFQMDICSFLQEEIDKEIGMQKPEEYKGVYQVCMLNKHSHTPTV